MGKWIVLLVVLLSAGGWFAWRRWGRVELPEVRSVRLARGRVTAFVVATGKIESMQQTTIRARIEGRVEKVLVEEGDEVARDQELILFDRREAENRAVYAEQDHSFATLETKDAQGELERLQSLSNIEMESKQRLDAARTRYEKACARAEMAGQDLKLTQIRLEKLGCKSPQGCVLIEKKVEDGQWVRPGDELLEIADVDHLKVIAKVDEADAPRVEEEDDVEATSDSLPGQRFAARVTAVAPYAKLDRDSMIVEVTIVLAEPTRLLRIGNEVDVRIVTEERPDAAWLPVEAVQEREGQPVVYVHENGLVAVRPVQVGISNPTQAEILGGLADSDVVLVPGDHPLEPGQAVVAK
ncbi:MAG: efflux RND transporter periplasmic adaptor subunit [Planctomycetota bacterium]